ncbi:MAG: hypothetical protein K6F46_12445 [Desulfovibrio sp.]|nr:hypothetical protein [Desulfovibrio sp.]
MSNVEVLVKGSDTDLNNLTNLDVLADRYGLKLGDTDGDGNAESMTLTDKNGTWRHDDNTNVYEHVGADDKVDLTLETTNMQQVEPTGNADSEIQQATFELQTLQ